MNKNKSTKPLSITIISASVILGLLIFFVSSGVIDKNNSLTSINTLSSSKIIDTSSDKIKLLYKYVNYREKGDAVPKLKKEQSTTVESFSNYEKYYYALQFVKANDLELIGEDTYSLSLKKVSDYMKKFFGNDIKYSTNCEFEYTFDFLVNNKNIALITYDKSNNKFIIKFRGLYDQVKVIDYYYSKIESAYLKPDNSIEIDEKVIYVDTSVGTSLYNISVYKDYFHTMLIESKNNISLNNEIINIDRYGEKTAVIKYIFNKGKDENYYFKSSIINN